MTGTLEELISTLVAKVENLTAKIENLEIKIIEQAQEIAELKLTIQKPAQQNPQTENSSPNTLAHTPTGHNQNLPDNSRLRNNRSELTQVDAADKNRRSFLKKLAWAGLMSLGAGATAIATTQKEAQARILVNPTGYELQFGAITTPSGTTISGTLGDTSVRIGLAACGDPAMDYSKLPLFDTGIYAQGAGYGVYAITDKSMGTGGYFRNIAPAGVGPAYAVSGISDNGTGIYGQGANSSFGVSGVVNGSGAGVNGNSVSGVGVSGFTSTGAALRGTADTGIPLRLTPNSSVPISGTRGKGDIYVDTLGRMFIWARNDANSADVWRQLQFVPA